MRTGAWGTVVTQREQLLHVPDLPADGRPLAVRIAEVLAAAIDAHVWQQGHRLPPAATIADRYATSNDTANRAIDQLAAQGLVRRGDRVVWVRGRRAAS